jgi:hypothetical protein
LAVHDSIAAALLFRRAQADQELDDELRDHLERKTKEYLATGMAPEEARRKALDIGGIENAGKSVATRAASLGCKISRGTLAWAYPGYARPRLCFHADSFAEHFTTFVGRQPPRGYPYGNFPVIPANFRASSRLANACMATITSSRNV